MSIEKIQYITATMLYGTVGMFLHYINLPSEAVVLCRGIVGTGTLLLVFCIQTRKINFQAIKENILMLCLSGMCLGLNWVFLFAAYRATTVAIASVCNNMAPIIVIAISPVVFREKLTLKKVFCISTAFIGVLFVSGVFEGGKRIIHITGVLLGLAAALAYVGIILCNKRLKQIDPLEKTVVQLGVSAITVFPYVIFTQLGHTISVDTVSIFLIFVLGVIHTGFAYILYFGSIGKLSVQSVAVLGYLELVVSVFTSVLVLKEGITFMGVIGAALVLGAAVYSEVSAE